MRGPALGDKGFNHADSALGKILMQRLQKRRNLWDGLKKNDQFGTHDFLTFSAFGRRKVLNQKLPHGFFKKSPNQDRGSN
jgi:hypothetical protein